MNPLMQNMPAMGGINQKALAQAKQMVASIKMAMNPSQVNAQLRSLCGDMSPQAFFDQQCREHGLDPKTTMEQIRQIING